MAKPAKISAAPIGARLARAQAVHRVRAWLLREKSPRLQMSLLVFVTGGAGFLASAMLLGLGMSPMWLRWPVALVVAYGVFLLLLWAWMRSEGDLGDATDLGAWPDGSMTPRGTTPAGPPDSGGGGFSGGGASGQFDASTSGTSVDFGEGLGDGFGAAAEAEELAIPVFVLALAGAVVLSSLWVITAAPTLFAELLVDGVLAASLYRRLRGVEPSHWLETALRRTAGPFAAMALILALAGWGLSIYSPEASSLGEALVGGR